MSKSANGGEPQQDGSMTGGPSPPLLSEKIIAQLQNAVSAAQRKRMPDPNDPPAGGPTFGTR